MSDADFSAKLAKLLPQVAEQVLGTFYGAPNKKLSSKSEIRYGKKGSMAIDVAKGTWYDHSEQVGGGTFDLLKTFLNLETGEAVEWLRERNLLEREHPQQTGGYDGAAPASPQGKFAGFMDDWPVAIFKYFDDQGALAYEVLKFAKTAPRRYMQRRPHPDSKGWIWGLQDGEYGRVRSGDWFKAKDDAKYSERATFPDAVRWLYRRDEVIRAKDEGRPIVLVEGEKDVETLRAWGITATTNAGGAKYWSDSFDDDLTGCDLIICGDNDDASRQRTLLRGASLMHRASSIRVLDLAEHWPTIAEKDDVTDWKEKTNGTKEAFEALLGLAKPFKITRPKSRYGAVEWDQLDEVGDELDFLIDEWITEGERSIIGGPSRSGKSFLAIHISLCIARGVPMFGYETLKSGGVIYQAGEGAKGVKRRLRAYRKHFGVVETEDVPFVLLSHKVDLYARDGDTQPLIDEINAWKLTMKKPLRMTVIDTLATATAGADENSGKDMGIVLANIARIAEACKCHVMLVHHMNADGSKLRGHTSVFANVDQVITVTQDEETKVRTARLAKQKDGEDGLTFKFALEAIKLEVDNRTGRDITSCVVVTVDEKEELRQRQKKEGFSPSPVERRIVTTIIEAARMYGKLVTEDDRDLPRRALGKTVINYEHYAAVSIEKRPDIASDDDLKAERKRLSTEFRRRADSLIKYGVIGVERPYMWLAGTPVRGIRETFPLGSQTDEIQQTQEAPRMSDSDIADLLDFKF